jgi:hypothetical protein
VGFIPNTKLGVASPSALSRLLSFINFAIGPWGRRQQDRPGRCSHDCLPADKLVPRQATSFLPERVRERGWGDTIGASAGILLGQ